jgi:hypothetical protein
MEVPLIALPVRAMLDEALNRADDRRLFDLDSVKMRR